MVEFKKVNSHIDLGKSYIAECYVVLDDCLLLNNIKLFNFAEKGYFLIFPSKQDVYKSVALCNKSFDIRTPKNCAKNGKYEEFYHPIKKDLYEIILNSIVLGYSYYKRTGEFKYYPK